MASEYSLAYPLGKGSAPLLQISNQLLRKSITRRLDWHVLTLLQLKTDAILVLRSDESIPLPSPYGINELVEKVQLIIATKKDPALRGLLGIGLRLISRVLGY